MLSYMYVTASCPPLRDGIESTSSSPIFIDPGDAAAFAPIACESQGGTRITSIEPRIGLPEHGAQHLHAQGDPSSSVLRDRPGASHASRKTGDDH